MVGPRGGGDRGRAVDDGREASPPARPRPETLAELSLEELLDVPVTIGTLSETKVAKVPAAVYVLDAEDIRRSGATSLPEALRWVPGLFVARARDSAFWNVGSRAFPARPARTRPSWRSSMGESSTCPSSVACCWSTVQLPLYDIDRIEVIRGPGSSTWGANAVTGVINIVARRPTRRRDVYAAVLGGNVDRLMSYLRYGDKVGDVKYRVYGSVRQPRADSSSRPTAATFTTTGRVASWASAPTGRPPTATPSSSSARAT